MTKTPFQIQQDRINKSLGFSADDILEKGGKGYPIGTIRNHGGVDYKKTIAGWIPVGKKKAKFSKEVFSKRRDAVNHFDSIEGNQNHGVHEKDGKFIVISNAEAKEANRNGWTMLTRMEMLNKEYTNKWKKSESHEELVSKHGDQLIKGEDDKWTVKTPEGEFQFNSYEMAEMYGGDWMEKGGEGSRGGRVIGHTKSGKPIYDQKGIISGDKVKRFINHHKDYSSQDHLDAADAHDKKAKDKFKKFQESDKSEHYRLHNAHSDTADSHRWLAKSENDSNDIEKGKKTGFYANTMENRRLGRVGQKYKKDVKHDQYFDEKTEVVSHRGPGEDNIKPSSNALKNIERKGREAEKFTVGSTVEHKGKVWKVSGHTHWGNLALQNSKGQGKDIDPFELKHTQQKLDVGEPITSINTTKDVRAFLASHGIDIFKIYNDKLASGGRSFKVMFMNELDAKSAKPIGDALTKIGAKVEHIVQSEMRFKVPASDPKKDAKDSKEILPPTLEGIKKKIQGTGLRAISYDNNEKISIIPNGAGRQPTLAMIDTSTGKITYHEDRVGFLYEEKFEALQSALGGSVKKSEDSDEFIKAEKELNAAEDLIEKGKALPIGTIKKRGPNNFMKTASGWKYHSRAESSAHVKDVEVQGSVAYKRSAIGSSHMVNIPPNLQKAIPKYLRALKKKVKGQADIKLHNALVTSDVETKYSNSVVISFGARSFSLYAANGQWRIGAGGDLSSKNVVADVQGKFFNHLEEFLPKKKDRVAEAIDQAHGEEGIGYSEPGTWVAITVDAKTGKEHHRVGFETKKGQNALEIGWENAGKLMRLDRTMHVKVVRASEAKKIKKVQDMMTKEKKSYPKTGVIEEAGKARLYKDGDDWGIMFSNSVGHNEVKWHGSEDEAREKFQWWKDNETEKVNKAKVKEAQYKDIDTHFNNVTRSLSQKNVGWQQAKKTAVASTISVFGEDAYDDYEKNYRYKADDDQLEKAEHELDALDNVIEKGKALPVGTIKKRGPNNFIKTANGWKYHSRANKGDSSKKKESNGIELSKESLSLIKTAASKIKEKLPSVIKDYGDLKEWTYGGTWHSLGTPNAGQTMYNMEMKNLFYKLGWTLKEKPKTTAAYIEELKRHGIEITKINNKHTSSDISSLRSNFNISFKLT